MDEKEPGRHRQAERERYARGLPDYHDPLAGFGGAPQALSALTLRLVLAIIGLVMALAGAVVLVLADAPVGFVVFMCVAAAVLAVDIAVILYRKHRGEPG